MSAPMPASDREAVESLQAANAALYAAVESSDFDAMTELWVDGDHADSSVCVHPGWPAVVGRGQVLRAWALIMANTTYIQFFLTDLQTTVDGDVAVVTCTENILTGGDDAEGGLESARVMATNVFRRRPGGWRLFVHHGSPVMPPGTIAVEGDEAG